MQFRVRAVLDCKKKISILSPPRLAQDTKTEIIQAVEPELPNLSVELSQVPLDLTNPLVWILVFTLLLSHTDEVINAVANLITAIANFKQTKQ